MRGWRDINPSIFQLLERAGLLPELQEGGYQDQCPPDERRSWGNLDDDLLDELAEERLFDRITEEECKCRR